MSWMKTPEQDVAESVAANNLVFGVSKPISYQAPTFADVAESKQAEEFLQAQGLIESDASQQLKYDFIGKMYTWLQEWFADVLPEDIRIRNQQLALDKEQDSDGTHPTQQENEQVIGLHTFGSFRLSVTNDNSDMDCLAMGPETLTPEDFFARLEAKLREMAFASTVKDEDDYSSTDIISSIHPKLNAKVPIITFFFNEIEVDLAYVQSTYRQVTITVGKLIYNNDFLRGMTENQCMALNGVRVTDSLLNTIPESQHDTFRSAVRFIKHWSQQRGLYGQVYGYLGGISWQILVARICQLYPCAGLNTILLNFFKLFMQWTWPVPITLNTVDDAKLGFRVWDPRGRDVMPILTPAYPTMNSAHYVTPSTLAAIRTELKLAYSLLSDESSRKTASFRDLMSKAAAPSDFFISRGNKRSYLRIVISGLSAEMQTIWRGWVESKIRFFVGDLSCTAPSLDFRVWPKMFSISPTEDMIFVSIDERPTGISKSDDASHNLSDCVVHFKGLVADFRGIQEGMTVDIVPCLWSQLPLCVFPESIRPIREPSTKPKKKRSFEEVTTAAPVSVPTSSAQVAAVAVVEAISAEQPIKLQAIAFEQQQRPSGEELRSRLVPQTYISASFEIRSKPVKRAGSLFGLQRKQ